MAKMAVAMSGGVDSTLTAWLLKTQGYQVIGLTLDMGEHSEPGLVSAARAACELGIPHHIMDVRESFLDQVKGPFLEAYNNGLTPNPCAMCNAAIKIPLLLHKAQALECQGLATGHYASLQEHNNKIFICEAKDKSKSQAYFLARIKQSLLPWLRFPLGDKSKQEVRAMAAGLGLSAAQSKESQDCCFIPAEGLDKLFLGNQSPRPGHIINTSGQVLGRHEGLHRFTIGQRRGLRLPAARPFYVLGLEPRNASVVVGHEDELLAGEVWGGNYLSYGEPASQAPLTVRLRYAKEGMACVSIAEANGQVRVQLAQPARKGAPGQLMVFNQGDIIVGSAWIQGARHEE